MQQLVREAANAVSIAHTVVLALRGSSLILSRESRGGLDLLKTVSNHPSLKFSRDNRWQYLGLVNEPCFEKGTGPQQDRYGLWLDTRAKDCPPDPLENETKYPGIKIGARGANIPVGSYYGYATGIVGLRLFPNPDFDEAAQKRWDPERYYTDPSYYYDKGLVKPYRVGMSCGFCHVGPNPTNPPADPENPKWANLIRTPAPSISGSIGSLLMKRTLRASPINSSTLLAPARWTRP